MLRADPVTAGVQRGPELSQKVKVYQVWLISR
jgi:hypothetical protein